MGGVRYPSEFLFGAGRLEKGSEKGGMSHLYHTIAAGLRCNLMVMNGYHGVHGAL